MEGSWTLRLISSLVSCTIRGGSCAAQVRDVISTAEMGHGTWDKTAEAGAGRLGGKATSPGVNTGAVELGSSLRA
eukprot:9482732-Pyramimonas_sp.AAC.1